MLWEVSTDRGTTFTSLSDVGVYSGSGTDTLTITGAAAVMSGYQFEAIFSNGVGTAATTAHATLDVQTAPAVTANPTTQTVVGGGTATFTAAAGGNPAPTVQWDVSTDGVHDVIAIMGATLTTYSFTATATDNDYQYEAVFSNAAGSATTTAASLTVNQQPRVRRPRQPCLIPPPIPRPPDNRSRSRPR